MVAALEVRPRALERGAPFLVNQPRRGIEKNAVGIGQRLAPLGLEVQRPTRSETLEDIVRPRAGRDQLRFSRAFEVRPPKAQGALKTAVLVDRKSTRQNSSHSCASRMPSSA